MAEKKAAQAADKGARCERRYWHSPRGGVNGGYFTCGGLLNGDACRKCGHTRVIPTAECPCLVDVPHLVGEIAECITSPGAGPQS